MKQVLRVYCQAVTVRTLIFEWKFRIYLNLENQIKLLLIHKIRRAIESAMTTEKLYERQNFQIAMTLVLETKIRSDEFIKLSLLG